jgi:hypothetical protein
MSFQNFNTNYVGGPFSDVNTSLVNADNSHYAGGFGSNETSLKFGLPIPPKMNGGARTKNLRGKIKNIVNKYKMANRKGKKLTLKSLKKRFSSKFRKSRKHSKKTHRRSAHHRRSHSYKQRGGQQYLNNVPYTPSFSTPGFALSPSESALANPVPFKPTNNCPLA